ncbi:MAG: exodeoxyribonuclease III [Microthrixaceae bacterium]|nr:exodeoxyribonuclease III [Microthrixaceae bacterium]
MLIATWNVNSLNARMPRVTQWLDEVRPDVLCLQETKLANDKFPRWPSALSATTRSHHGEGRWNGVAILSRVGIDDVIAGFDDDREPDPDARALWATCGGVRVCSVYVPNGREIDHDHYRYKLDWLARLRNHLDRHHAADEDLVVLGDWNVAPEDRDVWDPLHFEGCTHVSAAEREAIAEVAAWGLVDTLRERYPDGGIYSYWDYRNGDFHKRRGMRIDYLLASVPLARRSVADLIDRNARKGSKPSDHAPVMGRFD